MKTPKLSLTVLLLTFVFMYVGCSETSLGNQENTPLSVVIKYQSLTNNHGDTSSVKEFADLTAIYGDNAEEEWLKEVSFSEVLSDDNKLTNCFPFHKFKIVESIVGDRATVRFSKEEGNEPMTIEYTLTLTNGRWIITEIKINEMSYREAREQHE